MIPPLLAVAEGRPARGPDAPIPARPPSIQRLHQPQAFPNHTTPQARARTAVGAGRACRLRQFCAGGRAQRQEGVGRGPGLGIWGRWCQPRGALGPRIGRFRSMGPWLGAWCRPGGAAVRGQRLLGPHWRGTGRFPPPAWPGAFGSSTYTVHIISPSISIIPVVGYWKPYMF